MKTKAKNKPKKLNQSARESVDDSKDYPIGSVIWEEPIIFTKSFQKL